MKLNEFTNDELEQYKKALELLLERYIDNKTMACPLCNVAHNVACRMNANHDKGDSVCNYCIWSSYYDIDGDYDDDYSDLCTQVYQDKFEEFRDFHLHDLTHKKMKKCRIKEIKQWIGDINAISKKG